MMKIVIQVPPQHPQSVLYDNCNFCEIHNETLYSKDLRFAYRGYLEDEEGGTEQRTVAVADSCLH